MSRQGPFLTDIFQVLVVTDLYSSEISNIDTTCWCKQLIVELWMLGGGGEGGVKYHIVSALVSSRSHHHMHPTHLHSSHIFFVDFSHSTLMHFCCSN